MLQRHLCSNSEEYPTHKLGELTHFHKDDLAGCGLPVAQDDGRLFDPSFCGNLRCRPAAGMCDAGRELLGRMLQHTDPFTERIHAVQSPYRILGRPKTVMQTDARSLNMRRIMA